MAFGPLLPSPASHKEFAHLRYLSHVGSDTILLITYYQALEWQPTTTGGSDKKNYADERPWCGHTPYNLLPSPGVAKPSMTGSIPYYSQCALEWRYSYNLQLHAVPRAVGQDVGYVWVLV